MSEYTKISIKKVIPKLLLIFLVVAVIACGMFFTMKALGVNTIKGLQNILNSYGMTAYIIVILLQIIQVVFIPLSNSIITIPAIVALGPWPAFFTSWIGIVIGTISLYFIGKTGGSKLFGWVLGDKERAKHYEDMMKKKKLFYPIGMLLGVIPDDLLTIAAGMAHLNFLYVLVVSIISRGVCLLASIFCWGFLTKTWWGWCIFGLLIVILVLISIYYIKNSDKIEKKLLTKKE